MTGRKRASRKRRANTTRETPVAADRRRPSRWLVVALAVLGALAAGVFLRSSFRHPERGRPGGMRPEENFFGDSFEGPAFSPEATVDDLKEEAFRTADQLLETYPDVADSLAVAARLRFSLGLSDEAVRMWRRCVELDPGFAGAYFGLGRVAKDRGDLAEAVLMFEKVLLLDPAESEAPIHLTDALMKLDRFEEVVAVLERHIGSHMASAEEAVCLGQAYLQLKQYEKARQTFEALIETDPTVMKAYWGLGQVYIKLGQREKARQNLEKFRSLNAADSQSLVQEVRAYVDMPAVRGVLIQSLVESGQVYRSHGSLAQAEQMWRKAAFLEPKNAPCRQNLLSMYGEQNRDHDALRICKELCGIEPENPDHWLNAGLLNGRLGRIDEAIEALEKAIQIDPRNPRYRQAYDLLEGGR